jgi:putative membrane protein
VPTTKFSRQQIATAIAVLFHAIGLIGILVFNSDIIIRSTPINLLLMFALIIWTQEAKNIFFIIFIAVAVAVGIAAEIIGVNTGQLFGEYNYGTVLGYQFNNVPLIIGINWFVIIYCCGVSVHMLLMKAIEKLSAEMATPKKAVKAMSVIVDGATLAVFFDWLMEPAAVKLRFWQWKEDIPLYNYICWFVVSMLLLTVFHFCKFSKRNKFAVHLLLIQAMFFLILRTFLP